MQYYRTAYKFASDGSQCALTQHWLAFLMIISPLFYLWGSGNSPLIAACIEITPAVVNTKKCPIDQMVGL